MEISCHQFLAEVYWCNMKKLSGLKIFKAVLFLILSFFISLSLKSEEASPPGFTEIIKNYNVMNEAFFEMLTEISAEDPEMKIAEQEIRKSRAVFSLYSRPVPEGPSLEVSVKQGPSVSEAEAGISQKLSINGERGALRAKGRAETEVKEQERMITAFLRAGELRKLWFGLSEMKRIRKKLDQQERILVSLKARLGPGYQDAKFGSYAVIAFSADIATLRTEIRALDEEIHRASLAYTDMTGRNAAEIPENISYWFADPELIRRVIAESGSVAESNPEVRLLRLKAEAERAAEKAVSRRYYPSPELFLFAGQEQTRSSGTLGLSEKTSQDSYIRGGIRIPLPVYSGIPELKEIQSLQALQYEEKALRASRLTEEKLSLEEEAYRSRTELYKEVKKTAEKAAAAGPLIQSALFRRTISYSEFWTEQDRYHRLLFLQLNLYLEAMDSLSGIEILSGRLFI